MARIPSSSDTLVRVATAVLLGIHGGFRAFAGGVEPFGQYLQSRGIVFGSALAYVITAFEIIASLLLIAGRFVVPVALGHIAILVGGIILVHASQGWFVVGGGRNGVEFSVLLITCLISIILAERKSISTR
jgi:putative oxidoreductase